MRQLSSCPCILESEQDANAQCRLDRFDECIVVHADLSDGESAFSCCYLPTAAETGQASESQLTAPGPSQNHPTAHETQKMNVASRASSRSFGCWVCVWHGRAASASYLVDCIGNSSEDFAPALRWGTNARFTHSLELKILLVDLRYAAIAAHHQTYFSIRSWARVSLNRCDAIHFIYYRPPRYNNQLSML